jgi:hypothetical protein
MSIAARIALVVLPSLLLMGVPAQAQEATEEIEVGTNRVCDTEAQVQRFVALYSDDLQTAVDRVNAEANDPKACIVATIAYVRGAQLATARNKDSAFQIMQILVVGVVTPSGLESVTPAALFSLFEVDEIKV